MDYLGLPAAVVALALWAWARALAKRPGVGWLRWSFLPLGIAWCVGYFGYRAFVERAFARISTGTVTPAERQALLSSGLATASTMVVAELAVWVLMATVLAVVQVKVPSKVSARSR